MAKKVNELKNVYVWAGPVYIYFHIRPTWPYSREDGLVLHFSIPILGKVTKLLKFWVKRLKIISKTIIFDFTYTHIVLLILNVITWFWWKSWVYLALKKEFSTAVDDSMFYFLSQRKALQFSPSSCPDR